MDAAEEDADDISLLSMDGQLESAAAKYTFREAVEDAAEDLLSQGDSSDTSSLLPRDEEEEAPFGGRVHRGAVVTSHKQATRNNDARTLTPCDQQSRTTRETLLRLEKYVADEVVAASEDSSHASTLRTLNSEEARVKRKKLIYQSYLNYTKNHSRELTKEDKEELAEQWAARVIIEAVKISHRAIQVGTKASMNDWQKHGVRSRYEMNMTKTRDFRMAKPSKEPVKAVTSLDDDLERHGRVNYGALDAEPNSYLREYKFATYEAALRGIHSKKSNFKFIETIDLSGLLMGDQRLIELCGGLGRCPVHSLVLSNNHLTAASMEALAKTLRGLPSITSLNLSSNELSDKAVATLFSPSTYSPVLASVNLQFNPLSPEAAYHIGQMFLPDRSTALRHLYLGGSLGKKGFGDDFLRVLVAFVTAPDCKPLETLHYPEGNLSDQGLTALAALAACSNSLRVVNMTKNGLVSPTARALLLSALRVNRSVELFYVRQCGLTRLERDRVEAAVSFSAQLTWHELSFAALLTARTLDECARLRHRVEVKITNRWDAPPPPAWPDDIGSHIERPSVEAFLSPRAKARLLPVEAVRALQHLLAYYPMIDMLLLACDKSDEYLSELSRDALLRGSAGTAVAHNAVAVEVGRERERRREMMSIRKAVMQTVTDIYIKTVQEEIAAAKTANTGWSRGATQKKVFTEQHVGMAAEDYLASVFEYSASLEAYVGLMHQLRLEELRREPTRCIPYFAHMGAAGAYTHFVYSEWPQEERRRREIVERLSRDDEIRQLKEARVEKLRGSCKSGKRFDVRAYANVDPSLRPPKKLDLRRAVSAYSSTTDDATVTTIATVATERAADDTNGGRGGEEPAVAASPVVVSRPSAAAEVAARLEALASGQLEEEEEEEPGSVHYATVYRPSVQRQKDFLALSTIEITEEHLHAARFALNRSSRRYHVRPVSVPVTVVNLPAGRAQPRAPVFFLEEDERGEALQSLKSWDCSRGLVSAEDRLRIRQYDRVASRAADLGLK